MTRFRQQRAATSGGALLLALSIALLTALPGPQPVAAEEDYLLIEARIVAQRHDDGRVEVLLEVRRDSAGWVEQITPVHRFLPDPAPTGVWWNSSGSPAESADSASCPPACYPGDSVRDHRAANRALPGGHVELGLQLGVPWPQPSSAPTSLFALTDGVAARDPA